MKNLAMRLLKVFLVLVAGAAVLFAYNYLRFAVFWLPAEEVAFTSEPGITLRGTLVKPAETGAYPAVIILHGSGPESREEVSYRVMANTIARSGTAVLLYDKRGVGESDGDFESATFQNLVADAVAAVAYLAGRDDIDAGNIALLGNSQSGWFTPEVAYRSGHVAYIVNRVGPPLSWMDNVIWEVRNDLLADGVRESELGPLLENSRRRWEYYVDAAADPTLGTGARRDSINAELQRLRMQVPAAQNRMPEELAPYDADDYRGYAADIGYDPREYLEAIDVPILYVFAENDINVPTAQSVEFLESFRQQYHKDIEIVVLEGVGHSMAGWTGLLTAGYVPEFIDLLENRF